MRRASSLGPAAVALALVLAAAPGAAQPPAASSPEVAAALARVYPALVNVTVVTETYAEGRAVRYPGVGSGVVVTPEGHVLTNYHVVAGARRIELTLPSGEVLGARVVVHDPLTDLSVLEIVDPAERPGPLPTAPLGSSSELAVGQPVLALGNPLALASSVTLGIVSNPRRVFTDYLGTEIETLILPEGQQTGLLTPWIQHDALILPGNSGGPLVDLDGRVVGINGRGGGGLGFAIPIDVAREVLAQAVEHGEVRRSWLGASFLPVAKLGREAGALVSEVVPDGPAATAGVEPGDLLLAVGGEPVAVRFLEEVPLLHQRLASLPVGEPVELELERDGERRTASAVTAAMPDLLGASGEVRELGLSADEVTAPLARERRLAEARGLLVTGVRPGYAADAARPPLSRGDVLLEAAGRRVDTLAGLEEVLETEDSPWLVRFESGGQELVTLVRRHEPPAGRFGGELPRAWLGVETQVLTPELAAALGVPEELAPAGGFRVTEVLPGTRAQAAGLAVGDLLVALGGEPLEAARSQDREELRRAIERRGVGEEVALMVVRDGRRLTLPVELEESPRGAEQAARDEQPALELTVRAVSRRDRIDQRWSEGTEGVLVVEATPGGWAHMAGLKVGDLILELAGREVEGLEDFRRLMASLLADRPPVIPVFLRRGERTHFVFVEPDWSELD